MQWNMDADICICIIKENISMRKDIRSFKIFFIAIIETHSAVATMKPKKKKKETYIIRRSFNYVLQPSFTVIWDKWNHWRVCAECRRLLIISLEMVQRILLLDVLTAAARRKWSQDGGSCLRYCGVRWDHIRWRRRGTTQDCMSPGNYHPYGFGMTLLIANTSDVSNKWIKYIL